MPDNSTDPRAATGLAVGERARQIVRRLASWLAFENGKTLRRLIERRFDAVLNDIVNEDPEKVRNSQHARWLLDNSHLVRQALQQIEIDLPSVYLRQLAKLTIHTGTESGRGKTSGKIRQSEPLLAKVPRVFSLVDQAIDRCGVPVDCDLMQTFFCDCQETKSETNLTLGEFWAIPIALRVCLLTRLCEAAEACQKLSPLLLTDTGEIDDNSTLVAGCITSLRTVATYNWPDFVERISLVEKTLQQDPCGFYPRMDFASRDRYRGAVEQIAKRSSAQQQEVAEAALHLAQSASKSASKSAKTSAAQKTSAEQAVESSSEQKNNSDIARQHIGYYLIDKGCSDLKQLVRYRPTIKQRLLLLSGKYSAGLYPLAILAPALWASAELCAQMLALGLNSNMAVAVALIAMIPLLSVGSGAINFLLSLLLPPRPLPKLDFSSAIASEYKSIVVVPMMLSSADEIAENLKTLEQNYLGNADSQLEFALLADFSDAETEHMPEDEPLLQQARDGIAQLNQRYANQSHQRYANQSRSSPEPFVFLHRRRLWNDNAGIWMGWERKRGKLEEFNRLARGADDTSYVTDCPSDQGGSSMNFQNIQYVITLDADSTMPTGTACRLIATMAHPLNRPRFEDSKSGRVTGGYTVIQPRLEINPVTNVNTAFFRIFAGDVMLDLYTNAVSDVYQDLFGEGIFAGKGIYDLDAFQRQTLAARVPANAVLSHDLLEGLLGRAGLASDTLLLENYPDNYIVYIKRLHRWIRGDWQLLPWLFMRKNRGRGSFNPGVIGRWKLFENLRRSLVMPAILFLLLVGWLFLPAHVGLWTLLFALFPGLPILLRITLALQTSYWRWGTIESSVRNLLGQAGADIGRWLLALVFLPVESYVVVDAVLRTLYRLTVSGKRLLEWSTAAQVSKALGRNSSALDFWRALWFGPAIAAAILVAIYLLNPQALIAAAPLLLLWLSSPWVAQRLARAPEEDPLTALSDEDSLLIRGIARDTWRFFERFVGPESSWLPPDNVQEVPKQIIAERTSPTNIGMMLLSTLTAYDLGYVGQRQLLSRLTDHLKSIQGLRKHRGHLYNWYSTRDTQPLEPEYVSTVDSGNFVAALIIVRQALQDMPQHAQTVDRTVAALSDELAALRRQLFRDLAHHSHGADADKRELVARLDAVEALLCGGGDLLEKAHQIEHRYCGDIERAFLNELEQHPDWWSAEEIAHFRENIEVFRQRIRIILADIEFFSPWQEHLATPPALFLEAAFQAEFESLNELLATMSNASDLNERIVQARQIIFSLLETLANTHENQLAGDEKDLNLKDGDERYADEIPWLNALQNDIEKAHSGLDEINLSRECLIDSLTSLIENTSFSFLYDKNRHLFRVGYNATTGEADSSYYDLLASEARIASFIAIANGDVPARHWMQLGRPLTRIRGLRILLSWSATAFEYLMPTLMMRSPAGTLLNQSCAGVVNEQIRFGRKHHIPWGVSESGYAHFDAHNHYQYNAFGIPLLGLKWDQGERLVISSYASALAMPYKPQQTVQNLRRLIDQGASSYFGLYEALDFGEAHKPRLARPEIVQSYMAHHQGMILLAIGNFLNRNEMLARFHRDPRIASVEHLLHEQLPQRAETRSLERLPSLLKDLPSDRAAVTQWRVGRDQPELAVLSNGRLSSQISDQGGGALYWRGLAVSRWDPIGTGPANGTSVYFRDIDQDQIHAFGSAPLAKTVESIFAPHSVEFRARNGEFLMRMTITVAPDEDIEIRKITIANDGPSTRHIVLTSYTEPVLSDEKADRRHSAFSKLFIESQLLEDGKTLLFRRRPRDSSQPSMYLAQTAITQSDHEVERRMEFDRGAFLGRGGDLSRPRAFTDPDYFSTDELSKDALSRGDKVTLDPCAAISLRLDIPSRTTIECAFVSAVGDSRAAALNALQSFRSLGRISWTQESARMHSESELTGINIGSDHVRESYRLFARVFWPASLPHISKDAFYHNHRVQDSLWRQGVSGDRPIIVLRVGGEEDLNPAENLLRSLNYLSHKDVIIDLILLDNSKGGYLVPTSDRLRKLVEEQTRHARTQGRSSVFVVSAKNLSATELSDLICASRLFIDSNAQSPSGRVDGSPNGRVDRSPNGNLRAAARGGYGNDYSGAMPAFVPQPTGPLCSEQIAPVALPEGLLLQNKLGGMLPDFSGYTMLISADQHTPAPWCNVLANPNFGALVSESGAICSWRGNSSENRLTPWSNDSVLDKTGQAIYVRDEETGESWPLTPISGSRTADSGPESSVYRVTHGIGETTFEHSAQGLEQRLQLFVDVDKPLQILRVRLTNRWPRERRLTLTFVAEWLLGNSHSYDRHLLLPERDDESGALLVRNAFVRHGSDNLAFVTSNLSAHGVTCDGREFFGKRQSWARPAALMAVGLSDRVAPNPQPCAAYQVHVELRRDQTYEFHFALGAAENRDHASELINLAQNSEWVTERYARLGEQWGQVLGSWQVSTPDIATDAMINRWFLYQVVSSRLWGRVGFYQASGGFGFRDQLQDVLALLDTRADIARDQILMAAARQFSEGDVLHWWHEEPLRGVRTRISDDLLWLPYTLAEYLEVTEDHSILEDRVPFLQAEPLGDNELERYAEFQPAAFSETIYEHCCRAIDLRIEFGEQGLPFIGTGDWNDGLNRVGEKGLGESVWMAWFLIIVCRRFAPYCRQMEEDDRADYYERIAAELLHRTQKSAWAGQWYLRGYFDDGTPLGAPGNDEAEIDLNAQTWAVLADSEDPQAKKAMLAAADKLMDSEHRLIKLLAPPFDKSEPDPGYIRSYPRGVRENGGQYSHAAVWAPWAAVELGNAEDAMRWFQWLNPLNRAQTDEEIDHYRLEPYVMAGDIYGVDALAGRGGWSWYTGSAAWLYRLAIHKLLGLQRRGNRLFIHPCLPESWPQFKATLKYKDAEYQLQVHDPAMMVSDQLFMLENGSKLEAASIFLEDKGFYEYEIFASDAARQKWQKKHIL